MKTKGKVKIILMMLSFLVGCFSLNGCSGKREFGNGVYYSENDPDVYITVSDVQDAPDGENYYKTCKIQFSDTYDLDLLQRNVVEALAIRYQFNNMKDFIGLSDDEYDEKIVEIKKLIEENVDLKKQLVDNASEFELCKDEYESFESLFTDIVGSEECVGDVMGIEMMLDEDGSLVLGSTQEVFK